MLISTKIVTHTNPHRAKNIIGSTVFAVGFYIGKKQLDYDRRIFQPIIKLPIILERDYRFNHWGRITPVPNAVEPYFLPRLSSRGQCGSLYLALAIKLNYG